MRDEYIYMDEKTIRQYISLDDKKLLGKDYELGAAIILKGFFELENGFDCKIGLKLNPKYRLLYTGRTKASTVEEAKIFIEQHSLESDPVDVVISSTVESSQNHRIVWPIQLKRFGHFQKEKNTKGLIKFLSKIGDRYTKSSIILVVFFDEHIGFDPKGVFDHFESKDFPFARILFIDTNKNSEGVLKFHIGELWPTYSCNEYDIGDLLK